MAPEQIEGGDVDGRADVFGMGVLLYECMVGHLPFEGNNPAQVLRRVLDGLYPSAERERPLVGKVYSLILDRALARQVEDRFESAEVMREALASELARLGVATPRTELESYFDDPEAWAEEHQARLIGKLCDLGGEARRRGDAVAAASDYNRALAYAPHDPQLLRIVASMHRQEARIRLLRRVAPLALGAILLGTGAFFVARALKGSPVVIGGTGVPSSVAVATGPTPSAERSASRVVPSALPSERPVIPALVASRVASVDAGNGKKRAVVFASLQPQYGVVMKVDGVRGPDPGPGLSFMLPDDKAHALSFTCQDRDGNQLCVPKTMAVPAGDAPQTLDVQLTIVPAKLVVDGDPSRSYGIEEVPNITLAAGVASEIPLRAGQASQTVTVFDRSDPEKRRRAPLRAGQQYVVSFKNP
jgi:serine/threonine-protein kinase